MNNRQTIGGRKCRAVCARFRCLSHAHTHSSAGERGRKLAFASRARARIPDACQCRCRVRVCATKLSNVACARLINCRALMLLLLLLNAKSRRLDALVAVSLRATSARTNRVRYYALL